jgi:hypothetical protein
MMDQLLTRADELRPALRDHLTFLIATRRVQGAVLEVDQFWLETYLWRYFREPYWTHWVQVAGQYVPPIDWDFTFRPFNWTDHCKEMGYRSESGPFLIRVILYPRLGGSSATGEYPDHYQDYPIVYETRPPLEASTITELIWSWRRLLAVTSGRVEDDCGVAVTETVSVGRGGAAPTAGTLGGILRDPATGRHFLVSCAHVLGEVNTTVYTPGPYENRGMNAVGIVRFSMLPSIAAPTEPCNDRAAPNAGRLDVALAELLPEMAGGPELVVLPRIKSVRRARGMTPLQSVAFVGKVSGRVPAYLGACTIWMSIDFADGRRCFGSLFEVVAPSGRRGPLARKGDSGAWILDRPIDCGCWVGMLIAAASDSDRAYCCFAQDILEGFGSAFPAGLALVS